MASYTKKYVEGTVLSYDGRVYSFLLPGDETVVLKHSTVHECCQFPSHFMEGDHLKTGVTIHLCIIDKEDRHAVLPDHRFYLFTEFKEMPDGSVVCQDNKKALQATAKSVEICAKMIARGDTAPGILLLKALLSQIDTNI